MNKHSGGPRACFCEVYFVGTIHISQVHSIQLLLGFSTFIDIIFISRKFIKFMEKKICSLSAFNLKNLCHLHPNLTLNHNFKIPRTLRTIIIL